MRELLIRTRWRKFEYERTAHSHSLAKVWIWENCPFALVGESLNMRELLIRTRWRKFEYERTAHSHSLAKVWIWENCSFALVGGSLNMRELLIRTRWRKFEYERTAHSHSLAKVWICMRGLSICIRRRNFEYVWKGYHWRTFDLIVVMISPHAGLVSVRGSDCLDKALAVFFFFFFFFLLLFVFLFLFIYLFIYLFIFFLFFIFYFFFIFCPVRYGCVSVDHVQHCNYLVGKKELVALFFFVCGLCIVYYGWFALPVGVIGRIWSMVLAFPDIHYNIIIRALRIRPNYRTVRFKITGKISSKISS